MKHHYFMTGTDTEIGKTFVTCAFLHKARKSGLSACGVKPVAAGTDATGCNEDVAQIRAASSVQRPDGIINPYCFKAAVAPHIAAAEEKRTIEFQVIIDACTEARQHSQACLIEGVGGFRVPLGVDRDSADLAVALQLPVILVVGLRLGCINHALLTAEAILHRGLSLAGWVANQVDPNMARPSENIDTLSRLLPAPCLGQIPFLHTRDAETAGQFLSWPTGSGG